MEEGCGAPRACGWLDERGMQAEGLLAARGEEVCACVGVCKVGGRWLPLDDDG